MRLTRVGPFLETAALFILLTLRLVGRRHFCLGAVPHENIRTTAILSLSTVPMYICIFLLHFTIVILRRTINSNCGLPPPLLTRLGCTKVRSLRHPPPFHQEPRKQLHEFSPEFSCHHQSVRGCYYSRRVGVGCLPNSGIRFSPRVDDCLTLSHTFPPFLLYCTSLSCTVTNLTHQISHPRVFDDCHIMSSVIDLEAQQVAQTAPRAGAFFPLSHRRRSGNGSRGRGGRNRGARNGYPWASHQQCRRFTAVGVYWPRYQ
jgi:hypothetical protein